MAGIQKTDPNKKILDYFPENLSWEEKYKKIISLGQKLQKFNEEEKKEKWLIKACQSPLWLKADLNPEGRVLFTGDSESLITKGLLALIIEFYSKQKPEEILKSNPEFITILDFSQYLTARRTNGLQALIDQIRRYAQVFLMLSISSGGKEAKE